MTSEIVKSQMMDVFSQLKSFDLFSPGLLVFWPAAWSLTLVAMEVKMTPAEYTRQLGIFLLQTVAGYHVGNMWEKVAARTINVPARLKKKKGPAAQKARRTSILILLFELAIFTALIWPLNTHAFWNALLSLTAISLVSPFMKRVSYWPQAVLSLAMNWFLVVAWVANYNVNWTVLTTLFLAAWSWTLHYDSYQGSADRENTNRLNSKGLLAVLSCAIVCIAGLTAVGFVTKQDYPYFLLSVLGGAGQLAWQVSMTDLDDPKSRLSAFISNGTCFGPIVWSGLLINYLNEFQPVTAEYI